MTFIVRCSDYRYLNGVTNNGTQYEIIDPFKVEYKVNYTIYSSAASACAVKPISSDSVFFACRNAVALSSFIADTIAGQNKVRLTWTIANAPQKIVSFDIYKETNPNDYTPLTTIFPTSAAQTAFEYIEPINTNLRNYHYKIAFNLNGGCWYGKGISNALHDICHRPAFTNITAGIAQKERIIDFDVSPVLPSNAHILIDETGGTNVESPTTHITTNQQYRYVYRCPDLNEHTIRLRIDADTSFCNYNSKYVVVNCAPSLDEAALLPNPAENSFSVVLANKQTQADVKIYAVNGSLIETFMQTTPAKTVDCATYPKGFYFVSVNDGTNFKMYKLVKE